MTNKENRRIKRVFRELRETFGGVCSMCGLNGGDLEFAHIQKTKLSGKSRGRKERYYDILHNQQCYTLLCKVPCHSEFDAHPEDYLLSPISLSPIKFKLSRKTQKSND